MVHSGQPCGCGLISSFFCERWEPGSASTGRDIGGHFTLGESQSRLFLAASPPNSGGWGVGGERGVRKGQGWGEMQINPPRKEKENWADYSPEGRLFIMDDLLSSKKTPGLLSGHLLSVFSISPKSWTRGKWNKNGSGHHLLFPQPGCLFPQFLHLPGPKWTSSWPPSHSPRWPNPSFVWAPTVLYSYFSHSTSH